jgi:hypothetical protein
MPPIIPPDPSPYSFDVVRSRDEVAQGRVMFLAVLIAFALLWVLDFVGRSVLLVPAFLYEAVAAEALCIKVLILLFTAVFGFLTWAGIGWARYAFAAYLLICGLMSLMLSINAGAQWGLAPLLLAGVELTGAATLVMSISVLRFVEAQRKKPFPWLPLALTMIGTVCVLIAVSAFDLLTLQADMADNRTETQMLNTALEHFAPTMDPSTVAVLGNAEFQRKMQGNNFADFRATLGDFRGFQRSEGLEWDELLHRRRYESEIQTYNAVAYYSQADAYIYIQITGHGSDMRINDLSAQEIRHPQPPPGPAVIISSRAVKKPSR